MKLDDPLLLARAERSRELTLEGLALQHAGKLDEAYGRFMLALAANPTDQAALYSIAAVESARGHPAQALRHADRLVELYPDFALGHLARSQLLSVVGRMPEALQAVERALSIDPQLAGAADHRSRIQVALGQLSSQTAALPDPIAQLCLEGLNAQHAGQLEEARQCFERVLAADPANYVALYSLGLMAVNAGNTELARDLLGRAIAAHPDKPAPRVARATTLGAVGLYDDAIADLDAAIAVDPMCKEAYNNKATILHTLHRKRDAMLTLQAAYERFPTDERVLGNLGYLLTEFNEHTKAAQIFTDLLKQQPEYDYAKGLRFYAKLHACDWTNYEDERQEIIADVRAGKRVINPLAFLALSDDPADIRKCAEMFGAHKYPESPNPLWRGEKYHHRRKRVAFLSADFREHPVGYLLIGVIEQLDKKQIESIGVMVGPRDGSSLYTRYRNAFDHYWDAADKTSGEIARMLRAFEVDVLIDLSGYTAGTRLEVLAERVAPVQMTYLGYPGTLGVPYVDYLIADRVVIPEESRQFYSEEVLYLPGCYLPRDKIEVPESLTPSRESVGLEKFERVFCAFNHEYKITPGLFAEWMGRLRERPGSALWLRNHNATAKANLVREAERCGVAGKRLVFAARTPRVEDHLARFRLAEEFWDTFPYGGHTTASDALETDTPINARPGMAFQSRVAQSIKISNKNFISVKHFTLLANVPNPENFTDPYKTTNKYLKQEQ
jgi:predicted O-linked N-acetylglucosamine transferase (SPINDLY family)